jgi:hypothetical protein
MMNIPRVYFASAWQNRVRSSFGGEHNNIIGIDVLIPAKRAMDREQDRLDIKILEHAKAM